MNAMDDIRIRAGVESITAAEAIAVIEWCRDWAKDCEWCDVEDSHELDERAIPSLLRACDRHISGGVAFVLRDVRLSLSLCETDVLNQAQEAADRFTKFLPQGTDSPIHTVLDALTLALESIGHLQALTEASQDYWDIVTGPLPIARKWLAANADSINTLTN